MNLSSSLILPMARLYLPIMYKYIVRDFTRHIILLVYKYILLWRVQHIIYIKMQSKGNFRLLLFLSINPHHFITKIWHNHKMYIMALIVHCNSSFQQHIWNIQLRCLSCWYQNRSETSGNTMALWSIKSIEQYCSWTWIICSSFSIRRLNCKNENWGNKEGQELYLSCHCKGIKRIEWSW